MISHQMIKKTMITISTDHRRTAGCA